MNQPTPEASASVGSQKSKKEVKALKKREDRQKLIIDGLAELRSASQEIARSYLAGLEASIDRVATTIRDHQQGADKKRALKGRTLKRMTVLLDGISVKPDRGRRKDLKRVEQTVAELLRLVQRKKGK